MKRVCLLLLVVASASTAPTQPYNIEFNDPVWTRVNPFYSFRGVNTIDVATLARELAKEWANAFPTRLVLDGNEQSSSDLILSMIQKWADSYPATFNEVPQSEDNIKQINALAIRMVAEWKKEFPSDLPPLELSASSDAINAINDITVEMVDEWRKAFPINGNPQWLRNWGLKHAPNQLSEDTLMGINAMAIRMVKKWTREIPLSDPVSAVSFPVSAAPVSVSKDELRQINAGAIRFAKQWNQAFPMSASPLAFRGAGFSGVATEADIEKVNDKAIAMTKLWRQAFPNQGAFNFERFASLGGATPSDAELDQVNAGAIAVVKDWQNAFPITGFTPIPATDSNLDTVNSAALSLVQSFNQAFPFDASQASRARAGASIDNIKAANDAVISALRASKY